jgi:hypothetical protein
MKRKPPSSEQHKHCATERKLVRKSLREKGPNSVVELEKQYEELCRLREQVQIEESRQRILLRSSDDVAR